MITAKARFERTGARAQARGFTLVELMAVVIIIAILAALGVYSVRKYLLASKTSEATHMIGAIRTAQEAYKAETFSYLDISGAHNLDDFTTFYPQASKPKRLKAAWDSGTPGWATLGVTSTAPVQYTYGTAAGPGSSAPCSPGITIGNYPSAASGSPWYVVKAAGDLDGDGTYGTWIAINSTPEIFHDKQEE